MPMVDTVTLLCPEGAFDYPVSHGTREFYPYRADHVDDSGREFGGPWLVDVPAEVAQHFLGAGGFLIMAASTPAAPTGMVRLRKQADRPESADWGDYEADADGVILIPADHNVSALCESHGYEVVPEPEAAPEEPSEPEHPPAVAERDEPPSIRRVPRDVPRR